MKKSVDLIKLISISLLSFVFIFEYYSNLHAIIPFILVFVALSTKCEIQDACIVAIIVSSIIVIVYSYFNQNVEGFTDGTNELTKEDVQEMDKEDIKKELKSRKLSEEGKLSELRKRLLKAIKTPAIIKGCMDKKASNYNKDAKEDDGSCVLSDSKKEKKEGFAEGSGEDEEDEEDEEAEDGVEEDEEEDEEDEDGDDKVPIQKNNEKEEQENYVDIGTSFLEAYKNLSPQQIKSMTKDTKQLLGVQKNLMKTIEGLTPIVKEGKNVLDTFKGYFDELK